MFINKLTKYKQIKGRSVLHLMLDHSPWVLIVSDLYYVLENGGLELDLVSG
jgi:hypothetical protein